MRPTPRGGIDPSLQALLADDPQAFLDQTAALDQVARSQGTSLRRTEAARLVLAQLQVQLAQQQQPPPPPRPTPPTQKQAIDDKLAAAQALLSSLKADERRQARRRSPRPEGPPRSGPRDAPRPQPRPLAQASAQAPATRRATGAAAVVGLSGSAGTGRRRLAVEPGPDRRGLRPVQGRRTATSPAPTARVRSTAPVSPWRPGAPPASPCRTTPTRSTAASSTSAAVELRPGDLLFYFGSGAHHVAMYIGGGMMVSASNPSAGVEIIAAWGPWYGERYSGAGRVV